MSRRSAVLVRRGYVCAYEAGERPLPAPDPVLRLCRPLLLAAGSLAAVDTTVRVIALTYDDGPDPAFTPGILDALAAHRARATFFVLVEAAERHPELITRVLAEGHEIGLHGIDHTRLTALPPHRAFGLIRDGRRRLEHLTGRPVTLFRPAYGAQSWRQFLLTRALGLEVVIWSAWARDWDGAPAPVIADRALAALHRGGFLLLHDASGDGAGVHSSSFPQAAVSPGSGEDRTMKDGAEPGLDRVEATRLILAGMSARGYTSRTVSDLRATCPAVRTPWAERF